MDDARELPDRLLAELLRLDRREEPLRPRVCLDPLDPEPLDLELLDPEPLDFELLDFDPPDRRLDAERLALRDFWPWLFSPSPSSDSWSPASSSMSVYSRVLS